MKTECVLYEAAGSCAMYVTIYQKFLATSMKTQPSLNMYIYNQCIRGKNGSTEHSKGNKTVPGKVATARAEDGHKQNTKTSVTI